MTEYNLIAGFDAWFNQNKADLEQLWKDTSVEAQADFENVEDFALEIFMESRPASLPLP